MEIWSFSRNGSEGVKMDIVPDITRLLFIESELKNADMIMVPGSDRAELPEYAAALYKRGWRLLS